MREPVVSLYDLARCHAAVEAVVRLDKPIAEVPIPARIHVLGALVDDVVACAALSETGDVRVHVDYRDGVASCVFYRHDWCRAALAYVRGAGFPAPVVDWFQGLLFGYKPEAIERFTKLLGGHHELPRDSATVRAARRESLVLAEGDLFATPITFVDSRLRAGMTSRS
jgi:hypothetical protein